MGYISNNFEKTKTKTVHILCIIIQSEKSYLSVSAHTRKNKHFYNTCATENKSIHSIRFRVNAISMLVHKFGCFFSGKKLYQNGFFHVQSRWNKLTNNVEVGRERESSNFSTLDYIEVSKTRVEKKQQPSEYKLKLI